MREWMVRLSSSISFLLQLWFFVWLLRSNSSLLLQKRQDEVENPITLVLLQNYRVAQDPTTTLIMNLYQRKIYNQLTSHQDRRLVREIVKKTSQLAKAPKTNRQEERTLTIVAMRTKNTENIKNCGIKKPLIHFINPRTQFPFLNKQEIEKTHRQELINTKKPMLIFSFVKSLIVQIFSKMSGSSSLVSSHSCNPQTLHQTSIHLESINSPLFSQDMPLFVFFKVFCILLVFRGRLFFQNIYPMNKNSTLFILIKCKCLKILINSINLC